MELRNLINFNSIFLSLNFNYLKLIHFLEIMPDVMYKSIVHNILL